MNWKKYIPFVELYISVPLVRVQLVAMSESPTDYRRFTYVGYRWEVWKWQGNIKLYKAEDRFLPDRLPQDQQLDAKKCGCFISDHYKFIKYCDRHYEALKKGVLPFHG